MADTVLTVGHSNHAVETFVGLLEMHGVEAVADVRSMPYSRYNPQFAREAIKETLRKAGMGYVYLGVELGVRSDDPTLYRDGRVKYDLVAGTDAFHRGIARVRTGARTRRITLMCAEKEPLECHRAILVSRYLVKAGLEVTHIHADGHLESHAEALRRLARSLRMDVDAPQLFRSAEEVMEEVYAMQERRIAYAVEVMAEAKTEADSLRE